MCNCEKEYFCWECYKKQNNLDLNNQFIQQPNIGAKVYSLDTYKQNRIVMSKEEALKGSLITNQAGLDQHYANIEVLRTRKPFQLIEFNKDIS